MLSELISIFSQDSFINTRQFWESVFRKYKEILKIVTRRLSDIFTSNFLCDLRFTVFQTTGIYGLQCYRTQSDADVAVAVQHKLFRPVQKFRNRKSSFLTFPGLYVSHPLKIVYFISFTALLMTPYFTETPCTIAFRLCSQFSYKFYFKTPYIWKDVMLLQNKTVLRLKSTLIIPLLPYRTKSEVSDMLKQKNSRCNTEADMFGILIIRDTV